MQFEIDVQYADESLAQGATPSEKALTGWAEKALQGRKDAASLSIRITDEAEISELNETYRNKPGPTNVLSFPTDLPEEIDEPILGDIIICASVVEREAKEQKKAPESHWAHMVVHGVLHLLGYDHINDKDAEEMESLEISILRNMGYDNPYMTMEEQ